MPPASISARTITVVTESVLLRPSLAQIARTLKECRNGFRIVAEKLVGRILWKVHQGLHALNRRTQGTCPCLPNSIDRVSTGTL